jgi:uncharacterized protein (DUF924 family)
MMRTKNNNLLFKIMAFGLTTAAISEFASRPYILAALSSPRSPASVLSFYLGIDILADSSKDSLETGSYLNDMAPFWFMGHKEYDKLCTAFAPVVRDAGEKKLISDKETDWDSVDGKLSQLILCDQLSRNCFRGTDEAFKYDNVALEIAKNLAAISLADDANFYGSYSFFPITAFMHSEDLKDHKLAAQVIEKAKVSCPAYEWTLQDEYLLDHTTVVERFGRYPHRNKIKGRDTTKEEEEWLSSPDIPSWAKSQG